MDIFPSANNLVDLFLDRAKLLKRIFFVKSSNEEQYLSFRGLYRMASRVTSQLQEAGMNPGDQLILQIEDNQKFLEIFWGCILGGIVPVPLNVGKKDEHKKKFYRVFETLNDPRVIFEAGQLDRLRTYAETHQLEHTYEKIAKNTLELDPNSDQENRAIHYPKPQDTAFIQFSSGSTGDPKGVVLTHQNIIDNISRSRECSQHDFNDKMLSWMPLTHDMGLIGFHLNPLFCGMDHVIIPTELFVRRPTLWLDKATEHKSTILCSPNFGYSYLLKQLRAKSSYDWDLSKVRLLYNGAEPISLSICEDFLEAMAPYELKNSAMYPVYGLAEATLAVAFSGIYDKISSISIDRRNLQIAQPIIQTEATDPNALTVIKIGTSGSYACEVRVAGNDDHLLDQEVIGHVQIKGENVTAGYFNNSSANERLFADGGWLRTGDLGFFIAKDFYIVGRSKDVIFSNGQNYYAHDIEATLIQQAGLEHGKIAVGSYSNEAMQDVLLIFVLFKGKEEKFIELAESIRKALAENFDFENPQIVPVRQIPKTTSGKVERYRLAKRFEDGEFRDIMTRIRTLRESFKPEIDSASLSETEQELVSIWKTILGHKDFDIQNSFFSVGGNSLKAGQLLQSIKTSFHVALTFEVLYENPSIEALAEKIDSSGKSEVATEWIPRTPSAETYPASSPQLGVYHAWSLDPKSTAYNVPLLCKIQGEFDPKRWQKAFAQLINRHRILKSVFLFNQNKLRFSIQKSFDAPLEIVNIQIMDDAFFKECIQPFDLHQGPLYRGKLIHVKSGENYFLFDVHHSICDGISASLLMEELVALYQGNLASIQIDFPDVAMWLQNKAYSNSEKFWKQTLSNSLTRLVFPTNNQASVLEFAGAKHTYNIDANVTQQIKIITEKEAVSPFMLLFGVYSIVLSKYANNEDFIIGVPVAGRREEQLNAVIGMLVNNLVIPCRPVGEESFRAYLQRVKSTFLQAFEHQDYPFEQAMELLKSGSTQLGDSPLNTMFTYQHLAKSITDGLLTLEYQTIDTGTAKFDLSFEIFELAEELELSIEYKTSLFDANEIDRIYGYFLNILQQVIFEISTQISDLCLLDQQELQEAIYGEFNQQQLAITTLPVHELFDTQVSRTPEYVAVSDSSGTNKLTYKDLRNRSNQLAGYLIEQQTSSGNPIMVLMDQSPEFVTAVLAILKTGNHFVPVDPTLPSRRISYIANHCQAEILLTESTFIAALNESIPEHVTIVDIRDQAIGKASIEFENKAAISDLAYLIYTSGTTGNPKGVAVRHASLTNYVQSAQALYLGDEQVSFPLYTSISFDLTLTSIFVPLIGGHSIITYPQKAHEVTIAQVIEDNQVEVLKATPTHLRAIKALPFFQKGNQPSKLRKIIIGGEHLLSHEARELSTLLGNVEMYNEYGPTEATVGCMIHHYQPDKDLKAAVPIGKPFPNTRIYVLDKSLKPVPKSLSGELYIAGAGLAAGYLNDPSLTAQKFIEDPFHAGENMYKTGDLARILPDGNLEFLGRIDRQTKVNGYRIELEEIEHALLDIPVISGAVATVSQSTIRAYVVPEGSTNVTHEALLNDLNNTLPHYMLPHQIQVIDKIPITSNGKVDYDQLRALSSVVKTFTPPGNEIERILWETWKQVLGHEAFGIRDKFYASGGDSIKAIQVTSRLINQNVELSVKDLLTYQTIEQVSKHASFVENSTLYAQDQVTEPVKLFPIYHWFFEQQFEHLHWYHQSVLLRPKQSMDASLITACFQELSHHHDGLRIVYDPENTCLQPIASIDPEKLQVATYALSNWDDLPLQCEEIRNSIDLQNGPLFRVAFLEIGNEKRLFICIHHLLIDGISWRVLLEDFYGLYQSRLQGTDFSLPQKTAPLHLWAQALNTYNPENSDEQLNYWNELFRDVESIPVDAQETAWLTRESETQEFQLDKTQTSFLLHDALERYKVEPQLLMIVAWLRSLKKVLEQQAFIMEIESHGRHLDKVDVSRTIGWFTSLFPVKFNLASESLEDNIKEIKNQFQIGNEYGFAYGIRKYLTKDTASIQPSEPVDLRFNFLGSFQEELNNDLFEFDTSDTGSESSPNNKMTAKLDINAMVIHEELTISLTYNRSAHARHTIENLLSTFEYELTQALDHIQASDDVMLTSSDFDADLDQDELDSLFE